MWAILPKPVGLSGSRFHDPIPSAPRGPKGWNGHQNQNTSNAYGFKNTKNHNSYKGPGQYRKQSPQGFGPIYTLKVAPSKSSSLLNPLEVSSR